MILIDALYINNFGGKTILDLFGERLLKKGVKYHFIFDSRLKSNLFQRINSNDCTFLEASHKKRKEFYLGRINNFSSIICLSNVPPPINTSISTSIFFHNCLLLNPLNKKISIKDRLINFLKFHYIKYYNQFDYNWITQTQLINKLLVENLNINSDKVFIHPIFEEDPELSHTKKKSNDFIFVSSGARHKNHKRLIKAFIAATKNTNNEIKLHLTLNKEEFSKSAIPKNLKIELHGTLSRDSVKKLYDSCEYAIYPSLVESFGLPLIEAANHGCKVIASDLPYVHEIISPSLTFDPYSIDSISDSILKAIETDNLPETKVLVENKLDNFIDFIISQDVQQ